MANFDTKQLWDTVEKYVPVTLKEGAAELGEVFMPARDIEGQPQEEITRRTLEAFRRLRAAEKALDREWIREMAGQHGGRGLENTFQVAAGVVALQAIGIYAERAKQDPDEHPFLERLAARDSLDTVFHALTQRVREDFLAVVAGDEEKKRQAAERLETWLWQHVSAWAFDTMEKELGTQAVQALPEEDFDRVFTEYVFDKQDVGVVIAHLIGIYAQDYARLYLEALDPEGLPLEKLRRFLGLPESADLPSTADVRSGAHALPDAGAETAENADPSLLSDLLQNRNLNVFNGPDYHALREALARKDLFREEEGVPWPTAFLDKGGVRGRAQLRPAAVENQPLMSPEEVDAWAKMMWQQREELSDLDADALDALSAIWLAQARSVNDDAIADVDELLAMRGVQPKKSGQGRRGGYRPEQRAQMLQALSHIQNIWLDMAEVDAYEDTGKGKKRRTKQAIQSRPFVITDRMGQIRLDGYMDVQKFIFRPGKVFARFLMREGRQTALLSAKALHFDPYRQKWEKRLTRYLSWQWRTQAYNGQYMRPYRVATLLEQVGEAIDKNAPSRTRERFEKALDTLQSEGVIGAWQYDRWDEDAADKRGWAKRWEQATVLIEPPDEIRDHYQASIEKPVEGHKQQAQGGTLNERVKARRKMLRLSQLQAAEQIGISQVLLSQIERGRKPSSATQKKLEAWLSQAG